MVLFGHLIEPSHCSLWLLSLEVNANRHPWYERTVRIHWVGSSKWPDETVVGCRVRYKTIVICMCEWKTNTTTNYTFFYWYITKTTTNKHILLQDMCHCTVLQHKYKYIKYILQGIRSSTVAPKVNRQHITSLKNKK